MAQNNTLPLFPRPFSPTVPSRTLALPKLFPKMAPHNLRYSKNNSTPPEFVFFKPACIKHNLADLALQFLYIIIPRLFLNVKTTILQQDKEGKCLAARPIRLIAFWKKSQAFVYTSRFIRVGCIIKLFITND